MSSNKRLRGGESYKELYAIRKRRFQRLWKCKNIFNPMWNSRTPDQTYKEKIFPTELGKSTVHIVSFSLDLSFIWWRTLSSTIEQRRIYIDRSFFDDNIRRKKWKLEVYLNWKIYLWKCWQKSFNIFPFMNSISRFLNWIYE